MKLFENNLEVSTIFLLGLNDLSDYFFTLGTFFRAFPTDEGRVYDPTGIEQILLLISLKKNHIYMTKVGQSTSNTKYLKYRV